MLQDFFDLLNGNTARRRGNKKAAAGLAIGALVGAAAGILFAPKSGKETREDIKTVAEIGVENVGKVAQKAVEFTKEEAAEVKEKFNQFKSHLKASKADAEEVLEDVSEDIQSEEIK